MTTPTGETSATSDECPINLRYADSTPSAVDVEAIVRGGRRIRRRRTTASIGATGAFVVIAAVALPLPHAFIHRNTAEPAGIYQSSTLKSYPPVDATVVVLGTYADAQPANRSAIAWISQNGGICYGSADMSERSADRSLTLSCNSTAPDELTTAGPTKLVPGWPVFQPIPSKSGEFIAIGVLRGTAARVEVTANGQTSEAPVHTLPTSTDEAAGAYAVWVRAEPDGSIHSADITRIEAFDSSGRVVAQIP